MSELPCKDTLEAVREWLETPLDEEGRSRRDEVYAYLRQEMNAGRLLPGSVIHMDAMCADLGISRTPLRDALIRLDAEGVVKIYPRSRIVVNTLELEDVKYLYEVTGAIESSLVRSGAANYVGNVLAVMRRYNREMEVALDVDDTQTFEVLHYKFHQVFAKLSRNVFAERILIPIKNRLWDFPKKNFPKRWFYNSVSEHDVIIDLLTEGNAIKAAEFLKNQHWDFEFNKTYIQQTYFGFTR